MSLLLSTTQPHMHYTLRMRMHLMSPQFGREGTLSLQGMTDPACAGFTGFSCLSNLVHSVREPEGYASLGLYEVSVLVSRALQCWFGSVKLADGVRKAKHTLPSQ